MLFFLSAVLMAKGQNADIQRPAGAALPASVQAAGPVFSWVVVPSVNGTWGYEVLRESKLLIRQKSVPGLSGNEGFKTRADAEKVARLVIFKLENGIMPPTVTIDEMTKIKVL
jgi:hypothetical protein